MPGFYGPRAARLSPSQAAISLFRFSLMHFNAAQGVTMNLSNSKGDLSLTPAGGRRMVRGRMNLKSEIPDYIYFPLRFAFADVRSRESMS